ncbi:hypothetical protein D5086_010309 [Populus alba]|uniref:Uncharacterized protein n=1 Tax=Populus alba TaxID=43335 RepID=A0ACC4CA40_POPAL
MRAGTTHLNTSVPYSVSLVARASDPSALLLPLYVLYCTVLFPGSGFLHFYIAEEEFDSACDRHLFISQPILPLVLVVILKNYCYYLEGDVR